MRNDAEGVEIAAEGAQAQIDSLLHRLSAEAPPLARVDTVKAEALAPAGLIDFFIAESDVNSVASATTAIGPDVAVCADCLVELFEPAGRRWRHAFITCTHCGPRYTVTRALPYDRPQTSLAPFPLCPDCAIEYGSPANRRFHAETTCCLLCGPRLSLLDAHGEAIAGDPIAATLRLLQSGAIVAIKGLGGFHLACDARNAEAVAHLRWRKNREAKPFAVMAANFASLEPYADSSPQEQALLESRERPVVLLRARPAGASALPGVAPGLDWLGAMLPTTPIHYLLFHEAAGRPGGSEWLATQQELILVMTSANPGDEPIVRTGAEARTRLAGIADALPDHHRVLRHDPRCRRRPGPRPRGVAIGHSERQDRPRPGTAGRRRGSLRRVQADQRDAVARDLGLVVARRRAEGRLAPEVPDRAPALHAELVPGHGHLPGDLGEIE